MFAPVIDRPPHYLAQDVIAALVTGQYAVSDSKSGCACVIGDHTTGKSLAFGQTLVNTHQLNNISRYSHSHARQDIEYSVDNGYVVQQNCPETILRMYKL